MRVGFTGTDRGMTDDQFDKVIEVVAELAPTEVRHGDCVGADADFARIVQVLNEHGMSIRVVAHPSTIKSKRAYAPADETRVANDPLVRNRHIVDAANLLLVAPRGFKEETRSGTWATWRYAVKRGKAWMIVWPDGTTEVPDGLQGLPPELAMSSLKANRPGGILYGKAANERS